MNLGFTELLMASLAVWRVTHLLYAEDGPWDLFVHLRRAAGIGMWAKILDCFYCLSVWIALPVAAELGAHWKARALLWPALSGAAILLERATATKAPISPLAEWHEEPRQSPHQGGQS